MSCVLSEWWQSLDPPGEQGANPAVILHSLCNVSVFQDHSPGAFPYSKPGPKLTTDGYSEDVHSWALTVHSELTQLTTEVYLYPSLDEPWFLVAWTSINQLAPSGSKLYLKQTFTAFSRSWNKSTGVISAMSTLDDNRDRYGISADRTSIAA